ncbi:MAG TPA: photosynthetic reaction center cytochrome PufC [Steroidobacteraceae bacterium]|nr:photosynthetic reaction center cytochrome PufC [Steroidobacteraceae bacterium]
MSTVDRSVIGQLAGGGTGLVAAMVSTLLLAGCEHPPVESVQGGFRGTGMMQVTDPRLAPVSNNTIPVPLPRGEIASGTPLAGDTFKNVQVLKDVPVPEFSRLMVAMTTWVAPQQGCTYCHAATDLASDEHYTKVVARRMLQMTRHINSSWRTHVGDTGVTCYSCHRGHNVPEYVWFTDTGPANASAYLGNLAGQNQPARSVRLASLPNDPFTPYLAADTPISVIDTTALRQGEDKGASIKKAEQTYGLMMHITGALGVNCTFCHNSRSFFDWDQSTPQRATAWYGIRLVRELNGQYLTPLRATFPANRLGPHGDSPKVDCATCHQGAHKPLNGVSMLADYPELRGDSHP